MAGGWSKSLAGFARQVEQDISARQREMTLFALQQLIQHSPVDTGAYRGSHLVTIDSTDESSVPEPDKSGDRVRRDAEQVIAAAEGKPFKAVTIQSNIAYGESIEDGHSQQAPQGVYALATNNTRERYGG
ncbi:hypothetical protein A8U91_01332 [Halomonas elongata]|uniref:HK97 gp10 family phage protein n=1 Tax=Halomonas elongata TaxID=2746 RepID=A0A1B8P3Y3_HALEL|nr:hypothetical protein [Halomonas elongata]OBX36984.1 hypothetical protein A8U91_01332 [Halomonas elongata]